MYSHTKTLTLRGQSLVRVVSLWTNFWGKSCLAQGSLGQFWFGKELLPEPYFPACSLIFLSLTHDLCSLYSNKRLSLLFPSLSPNENVLGNSCWGSNPVFEKETEREREKERECVFVGMPKWSELYLSVCGWWECVYTARKCGLGVCCLRSEWYFEKTFWSVFEFVVTPSSPGKCAFLASFL